MNRPSSSGPDDFDPSDPNHWPLPPEPSDAVWEKTRTDIIARLPQAKVGNVQPSFTRVKVAAGLLAAGILVAWGLWALSGLPAGQAPKNRAVAETVVMPPDALGEYEVLPIATSSDVMVSAVRGSDVRFGTINHPVPEVMPLTSAADVTVHRGPVAGELSCVDPSGMAVYVMPPADK